MGDRPTCTLPTTSLCSSHLLVHKLSLRINCESTVSRTPRLSAVHPRGLRREGGREGEEEGREGGEGGRKGRKRRRGGEGGREGGRGREEGREGGREGKERGMEGERE